MEEKRTQFELLHNHDGINSQRIKQNNSKLSPTSKGGFLNIPYCLGTPTGIPNSIPSLVYDSTNDKLYIYVTRWKSVTFN